MEGRRIKWGNIIIFELIIAVGIAAISYKGNTSGGGFFGLFSNSGKNDPNAHRKLIM